MAVAAARKEEKIDAGQDGIGGGEKRSPTRAARLRGWGGVVLGGSAESGGLAKGDGRCNTRL